MTLRNRWGANQHQPYDEAELTSLYLNTDLTLSEIAAKLDRTVSGVEQKIKRMSIRRRDVQQFYVDQWKATQA